MSVLEVNRVGDYVNMLPNLVHFDVVHAMFFFVLFFVLVELEPVNIFWETFVSPQHSVLGITKENWNCPYHNLFAPTLNKDPSDSMSSIFIFSHAASWTTGGGWGQKVSQKTPETICHWCFVYVTFFYGKIGLLFLWCGKWITILLTWRTTSL